MQEPWKASVSKVNPMRITDGSDQIVLVVNRAVILPFFIGFRIGVGITIKGAEIGNKWIRIRSRIKSTDGIGSISELK